MGKTFTADTQAMKDAAAKLEEISKSYVDISTQLMQKAQTMGSAWDSEDNLAFVAQITGFADDLKSMSAKLESDAEVLRLQSQNYDNKKDDNVSQVKKLAN